MKTRGRKLLLATLLVVGIAAILYGILYLASPHEPSYEGKTLSEWIIPFCRQTATNLYAPGGPEHFKELQPVRHAVSQIGTNGLPFLIARLNRREPAFHRTARQLADKQPLVALRLTDPRVPRVRAIRALAILGPAAQPAIPSLSAQLTDPVLAQHAVYALSGMGPDGMRALIDHLTNAAPTARMLIAMTLTTPNSFYRGENHIDTNRIPDDIVIEGLSRIVKDPTSPFRIFAINRLGTFGSAASNAIPALTNLLTDPNLGVNMAAGSALRAMGYNAPDLDFGGRSRMPRKLF